MQLLCKIHSSHRNPLLTETCSRVGLSTATMPLATPTSSDRTQEKSCSSRQLTRQVEARVVQAAADAVAPGVPPWDTDVARCSSVRHVQLAVRD
jgi:hypothetical protein